MQGTGFVCAAAEPYGRFLYMGKNDGGRADRKSYARQYAKKVLVSQFSGQTAAKENLEYTKQAHPRHRQSGLTPLNGNTAVHGFAK